MREKHLGNLAAFGAVLVLGSSMATWASSPCWTASLPSINPPPCTQNKTSCGAAVLAGSASPCSTTTGPGMTGCKNQTEVLPNYAVSIDGKGVCTCTKTSNSNVTEMGGLTDGNSCDNPYH